MTHKNMKKSSTMAARSELGISPVLLQAIATLTSSSLTPSRDTITKGQNKSKATASLKKKDITSVSSNSIKRKMNQHSKDSGDPGIVTQLLQNINEPISSLISEDGKLGSPSLSTQDHQSADQSQSIITQAGLSFLGISSETEPPTSASASSSLISLQSQQSVGMVISNEEMNNFLLKEEPSEDQSDVTATSSQTNLNTDVSSMLTALASQHIQQSLIQKSGQQLFQTSLVASSNGQQTQNPSIDTLGSSEDLKGSNIKSSGSNRSQHHIIIYSNGREFNIPVAGAQNAELVMSPDSGSVNGDQQMTYRVLLSDDSGGDNKVSVSFASHEAVDTGGESSGMSSSQHSVPVTNAENTQEGMTQPCPVCGDKVSGYHYGIFTCESCKGFFKRTVQNKKSFVCPRNSDCDINSMNRKKCPACRFKRCLIMGMKLEAIRQDRTRGGRSSYDGCGGAYKRSRVASVGKRPKKETTSGDGAGSSHDGEDGAKSHRNLVAILNHNAHKQAPPNAGVPQIPELLRDIMNLEPLLSDDDISPDPIMEAPFPEQALYSYMMQLAELRLYKLVRWARNLPQFGAISTDDQILLLQNCWSELMALSLCWRSIDTPHQISVSSTHHITAEWAQHLGFEDVVLRLLNITAQFRKLYLDQFEYVALKVLLLITPDVKGLKEPRKIREFQEKLQEALYQYTSTHYQNMKHKFGELLLRLPELSRISFISKDILLKSLPESMASCGLLVELLKGENKGDSEGGGLRL